MSYPSRRPQRGTVTFDDYGRSVYRTVGRLIYSHIPSPDTDYYNSYGQYRFTTPPSKRSTTGYDHSRAYDPPHDPRYRSHLGDYTDYTRPSRFESTRRTGPWTPDNIRRHPLSIVNTSRPQSTEPGMKSWFSSLFSSANRETRRNTRANTGTTAYDREYDDPKYHPKRSNVHSSSRNRSNYGWRPTPFTTTYDESYEHLTRPSDVRSSRQTSQRRSTRIRSHRPTNTKKGVSFSDERSRDPSPSTSDASNETFYTNESRRSNNRHHRRPRSYNLSSNHSGSVYSANSSFSGEPGSGTAVSMSKTQAARETRRREREQRESQTDETDETEPSQRPGGGTSEKVFTDEEEFLSGAKGTVEEQWEGEARARKSGMNRSSHRSHGRRRGRGDTTRSTHRSRSDRHRSSRRTEAPSGFTSRFLSSAANFMSTRAHIAEEKAREKARERAEKESQKEWEKRQRQLRKEHTRNTTRQSQVQTFKERRNRLLDEMTSVNRYVDSDGISVYSRR